MLVQELYNEIGANYDEAKGRMMKDALIVRFCKMFLDDGSYCQLVEAMEAENATDAFAAAHTLKGVCANLAFTSLAEVASEVTEALRNADSVEDAKPMMPQLTERYNQTVSCINELEE
ncbi:MAG: Hpt domain-containing protein [Lachnospiraceae bacterium]|nr:Hpt domain-containing protein [Lachnospiraceae bacterium]